MEKTRNEGDVAIRQSAIDARRYTFGNDEFSLEAAYHDCKLVFDGITDDDSFQEADTGLILYYANEIIYALHEALDKRTIKRTETHACDCISREAAIDAVRHAWAKGLEPTQFLEELPSAQPAQRGRIFQEIVVEYPFISAYPEHEGKPYFSIKYEEGGQGYIGYGTYKPEVLSQYLKEYFMPSAQPDPDKLHLQREQAYMQGWEDARLIDRQAAIDVGRDLLIPMDEYHMYNQAINNYCAELINLPAAQPEWEELLVICDNCGHAIWVKRH